MFQDDVKAKYDVNEVYTLLAIFQLHFLYSRILGHLEAKLTVTAFYLFGEKCFLKQYIDNCLTM